MKKSIFFIGKICCWVLILQMSCTFDDELDNIIVQPPPTRITVYTHGITQIDAVSAASGGTFTINTTSSVHVVAVGVCWSTATKESTVADDHTNDGIG